MTDYPSLALVFAAGLLSFLSPCVLPLIPSYISILGSVKTREDHAGNPASGAAGQFPLLITTGCFILGFSAVFVILSILISATFLLMGGVSKYLQAAAGIIVIILGLNVLFDFLTLLNYEKRFHVKKKTPGRLGAFLAGAAFGTGWTPCIGPILTSVLLLAGQNGKAGMAALYLAVYSLGLGLPFLLAAAFFDRFLTTAAWFRARLRVIKTISGIVLIVMGVLILTGRFSILNIALQKWQFRFIDWAADKALPFRLAADWLNWLQNI
ncbi:MAG: cytochrome c biogenesis protein CcdA [Treponema sp.]|jgi:cytochrome c-type biogenesis protein|nr:cytochrome c biogenesis protein CcdA [Treponema sp.]